MQVAAGRDAAVLQAQGGQLVRRFGRFKGPQLHLPALLTGWSIANSKIATGRDNRTGNASSLQDFQRLVSGVALGNAAEVELHSRLGQDDALGLGIKLHVLPSRQRLGFGKLIRSWQRAFAFGSPPQICVVTDGDVEGSITHFGKVQRALNHVQQVWANNQLPYPAKSDEFAVWQVIGTDRIQCLHALKSRLGSALRLSLRVRVAGDAEQRAHGGLAELTALQCPGFACDPSHEQQQKRRSC